MHEPSALQFQSFGFRVSPDRLNWAAMRNGALLTRLIELSREVNEESWEGFGVTVDTRYAKLADYLGEILEATFDDDRDGLGKTRLALCEQVPPMSLHIGIIRVLGPNHLPLLDILIDTSDNEHVACSSSWAHVSYHPWATLMIRKLEEFGEIQVNHLVEAY